jgi:hypothetical protein
VAEKKINGRTFKVEPLLATKALVLQARLARLAGPAIARLGEIMQGYGRDKTDEEKARSNTAAISAFSSIFAEADPEELAALVKEVIEIAMIRRESGEYFPVDLDGDLTGHASDIIPLVVFVLREQFGDFFSALPGLGALGSPARA